MPLIDVSQLLHDPDFTTTFVVARGTQTVDSHGRASETRTTSTQTGVVYPASGNKLIRTPEGENIIGDITIVTQFQLTEGDGASNQADLVTWNGRTYTVVNTNDYSQYGNGFIEAVCIKKTLT